MHGVRGVDRGLVPLKNPKKAIYVGFLRYAGMDHTQEAIGALGPIVSKRREVKSSVKYIDD